MVVSATYYGVEYVDPKVLSKQSLTPYPRWQFVQPLKHGNLPTKSQCRPFLLDNMYIAIFSQILTELTSGTQTVAIWLLHT